VDLAPAEAPVHKEFVSAVKQGQGRTRLEYLLSRRGANVDARDGSGLTALYYAAFQGNDATVQFLIDNGADVNPGHRSLGTPLAVAALRRHSEVVKTLLLHQADIFTTSSWLGSALHCACFSGDLGIFLDIMLYAKQNDCLQGNQAVHLDILREMSGTSFHPSQIGELKRDKHECPGRQIKCSPTLLAGERSNFRLLRLCRLRFDYDYVSESTWEVSGEEGRAGLKGSSRSRTNGSYNSARSGGSEASKASTTSSWSSCGLALVPRKQHQGTLLMWAAAQLNITLVEHLRAAGAPMDTQDDVGRNALHYAALPFADAIFGNVRQCVDLLMVSGTPILTRHTGQQSSNQNATLSKSPLDLVVSADHTALDPRVTRKWGPDIHRRCISSFLDPLKMSERKLSFARDALLHALSHHLCPAESIELLCKNAVRTGPKSIYGEDWSMDEALNRALETRAGESIISIILDNGASANTEHNQLPLIAALASGASVAVVSMLLQRGADPNVRQSSQPKLTALEYVRKYYRREIIDLFESKSKSRQSYLTPRNLIEPAVPKLSGRGSRDSRMYDVNIMDYLFETNKLEDLPELDEQDDSDDSVDYHECMDTPEAHNVNEAQVSRRSSRPWLPAMSRFLGDGRPK